MTRWLDTDRRRGVPMAEALGDGRSATSELALEPGELITHVGLPPPLAGERAAYKRAIGRAHAEWPLVELVVVATLEAGRFARLRLVAGGVAPIPLRLAAAEAAATGTAGDGGDDRRGGGGRDRRREPAAALALQARPAARASCAT